MIFLPVSASESATKTDAVEYVALTDIPYRGTKLDQRPSPLETLDLFRPVVEDPEQNLPGRLFPVVVYLHGGGWAFGDKSDVHLKPLFFTHRDMAFISMNYRLRWNYKVYDQLTDVVSVISWIHREGEQHGLDPTRIVLMGHAAGAHLATLVTTDNSYFEAEGIEDHGIKVVVGIDSISYDIPRLMRELGSFVERRQHELIFGNEESVWKAALPVTHVTETESRKRPGYALLFNPEKEASSLQAKGFAKALTEAKTPVVMIPGSTAAPDQTDELIGRADNVATGAMMAFIISLL